MKPDLYFLHLKNIPINEQLSLEETLLRNDTRNFCLVNHGAPPAIVVGQTGQIEDLLSPSFLKTPTLPVFRRFSAGGTVVIDQNTLFLTFICQKGTLSIPPYPEAILKWTEKALKPALSHSSFCALDNDYTIEQKKCGGNAQYISQNRWLHHSSLLWDYDPILMDILLLPKKMPSYRKERPHGMFLHPLKDCIPKEAFIEALFHSLKTWFKVQKMPLSDLPRPLSSPSTKKLL